MIFKDYYKILGLDTNKISDDQIKTAFREQAKKYHPDVNIGDRVSEERFKDINESYRVLSNPMWKKKYDKKWNTYVGKRQAKEKYDEGKRSKDSFFSDFAKMFFGTEEDLETKSEVSTKVKKKIPVKGENIDTEVTVNIDDAFMRQREEDFT